MVRVPLIHVANAVMMDINLNSFNIYHVQIQIFVQINIGTLSKWPCALTNLRNSTLNYEGPAFNRTQLGEWPLPLYIVSWLAKIRFKFVFNPLTACSHSKFQRDLSLPASTPSFYTHPVSREEAFAACIHPITVLTHYQSTFVACFTCSLHVVAYIVLE